MKKNIILFSFSTAINKGSIFFFFPILTQFLTLEDFGKWSLAIIVSNLLVPIISLNGSAGILREGSSNKKVGFLLFRKYIYLSTIVGLLSGLSAYFLVGEHWFFYSILISFTEAILILSLTYIRTEEKAITYFFISLLKALALFLVILYAKNYNLILNTLLAYHVMVMIIFTLIIAIYIYTKNHTSRLYYEFTPILIFGITLIPHGLSQWIMSSSDRIILENMFGSASVGIYSLAYNLALVLMLLNSGIALALPPYMIKKFNRWKKQGYDNKLINYYTIFSIFFFFVIIFIYFLDQNYFRILGYYGSEMIPLIVTLYVSIYILGLYYFYANYIFYYKKAFIISKVTFKSAILNIALTICLAYFFGVIGAALATLLAYIYYLLSIRSETLKIEPTVTINLTKSIVMLTMGISICTTLYYLVSK